MEEYLVLSKEELEKMLKEVKAKERSILKLLIENEDKAIEYEKDNRTDDPEYSKLCMIVHGLCLLNDQQEDYLWNIEMALKLKNK